MKPRLDLIGQRFNRWLVVARAADNKQGQTMFLCVCDCGLERIVRGSKLTNGYTKSCGCFKKEVHTTHGMHRTPEYVSWQAMVQRCTNPNSKEYPNYGGRGLTISESWMQFENFYADMGPRLSPKHSLDRRDNMLGYIHSNCYWATRQQQQNNTRRNVVITYGILIGTIAQIYRFITTSYDGEISKLAVSYQMFHKRVKSGWEPFLAAFSPLRSSQYLNDPTLPRQCPPETFPINMQYINIGPYVDKLQMSLDEE